MTRISCGEAQALMQGALGDDGAVPAALETHLAGCAACAEAWTGQLEVRALLASRAPEPLPAGFSARLEAAIDDLQPWWTRFDWRWWTLRAAPVAAALLLVGGAAAGNAARTTPTTSSSSVSAALWADESTVSGDSLLLAVLSGSPDDAVSGDEESTP